jgi:hypothetical protein
MKIVVFSFLLVLLISCGDTAQEKKENTTSPSQFSATQERAILVDVSAKNEKEVSDWQQYTSVRSFLDKFKKATPNEVLGNALELTSLIKALKDSVKPEELSTLSFNARVNLLENESLRLTDMTRISAITAEEIDQQVIKIFEAFSALNSKINTVYLQRDLDKNINFKNLERIPIETKPVPLPKPLPKKAKKKKGSSLQENLNLEKKAFSKKEQKQKKKS